MFLLPVQVMVGVTTDREEEEVLDPQVLVSLCGGAWPHAPPVTVARWNTRRQLFLSPIPVQKGSFAIPGVLGD